MPANLLPLEHLSDADFDFLAGAVSPHPDARDRIARLLRDGGPVIERALDDERCHRALNETPEAATRLSPYLLFAILLHRRRRAGAGGEDGPRLLESPWTRYYLVELLAGFCYDPPGSVTLQLAGRTIRSSLRSIDFSALNKHALLASDAERLCIYRRLGDLTLFLSGAAGALLPAADDADQRPALPYSEEELEREGRRYYELAAQHRAASSSYLAGTLRQLVTHYAEARQVIRQAVNEDLPRVYPGGFRALARRQADSQRFIDLALSAPDGGWE